MEAPSNRSVVEDWTSVNPPDDTPATCAHSESYAQALEKWSNYSLVWYNETALFRAYVCMNVRYEAVKEACESTEAQLILFLGVFGIVGAILSTLTFFRRPFVPSEVFLYRLVGGIETVHMFIMASMHSLTLYIDCSVSYACVIFSAHIYITLTNGCADAVEFVVVFLCFERTVACMAPHHFHRIHRLATYRAVALLAVLSAVPLNIVHSFDVRVVQEPVDKKRQDMAAEQRYRETPSEFASSWLYARVIDAQLVRFCAVAPLIIVTTAGSILGLTQAARRKRRLRADSLKIAAEICKSNAKISKWDGPYDHHSKIADRSRKEIKQMTDLCCLQLCLAVPVVINYFLCLVERACKMGIIDRNKLWEEAFRTMSYEEAGTTIKRATMLEYLRFAISVTHMMAHNLHFYLYLLFSAKFRLAFSKWPLMHRLLAFSKSKRNRDGLVAEALIVSTDYERVPMDIVNSTCEPSINETTLAANGKV